VNTVLSNSFGFGGNNAALVWRRCEFPGRHREKTEMPFFAVLGESCLTGAGDLAGTLAALEEGKTCQGLLETAVLSLSLDSRTVRRLKRLPRMALALASAACPGQVYVNRPDSVFFGSGWGTLSETHDFLARLFETGDRFSSPADFIGSVHNAPAGQVGIEFKATGPNVTMTGGDATFEQALTSAALLAEKDALLVMGADEYHPEWSPLFDLSVVMSIPSDGGGALWLKRSNATEGPRIHPVFHGSGKRNGHVVEELAECLNAEEPIVQRFAAVMAGLPAAQFRESRQQLDKFLALTGFCGPVLDYRRWLGEFASASAVAAVLGVSFVRKGEIPAALNNGNVLSLDCRGILCLGMGDYVSAVEILS
jgi:3-oxoacyl-[acyl-carrier-protein] synthase-1/3-oxoacyl-[acyl-carrier-protein] synthase II